MDRDGKEGRVEGVRVRRKNVKDKGKDRGFRDVKDSRVCGRVKVSWGKGLGRKRREKG